MLHVLHGTRGLTLSGDRLKRVEIELDLRPHQRCAWRVFADLYGEARSSIEAIDAFVEHEGNERPLAFKHALENEAKKLAVRLGAARHIAGAAEVFLASLTPQQRVRANRLLWVVGVELGLLHRPAGGPFTRAALRTH
jgi:LTXXQ motif family protein